MTLSNVSDGQHWWVATAYDLHNNESAISNEVGSELDTTAPDAPGIQLISVEINK